MNGVMAGLANDKCFASSFHHDVCPVGSSSPHAFQVCQFADVVNNTVLTFERTTFACARYESPYHLLLFIANGGGKSINQDGLFLVGERDTAEGGNQGFLPAFALFGDLEASSKAIGSLNDRMIAVDHCLLTLAVFGC